MANVCHHVAAGPTVSPTSIAGHSVPAILAKGWQRCQTRTRPPLRSRPTGSPPGRRRRPRSPRGSAARWSTTTSSSTGPRPRWCSRRSSSPRGNAAAATVASLATFGVGYVARPIGSFLMGHLGDKLGRKPVLIGTLLLMGVSTFLVGCLPTYDAHRHPGADPPRRPAPPPGPLGGGRAGGRQLDVLRARTGQPARLLHQLDPERHPGWPGAGPRRVPSARRAALGGAAADLGLADPVPAQRHGRRRWATSSGAGSRRHRSSRRRSRTARSRRPRCPSSSSTTGAACCG